MSNWLVDANGYIFRYTNDNGIYRKIYQHDEIIEGILGRPLKKNECVHHIHPEDIEEN